MALRSTIPTSSKLNDGDILRESVISRTASWSLEVRRTSSRTIRSFVPCEEIQSSPNAHSGARNAAELETIRGVERSSIISSIDARWLWGVFERETGSQAAGSRGYWSAAVWRAGYRRVASKHP